MTVSSDVLTEREKTIIELKCQGYPAWEIGERLGISQQTVHFHVKNVIRKAEARSLLHAVTKFWLSTPSPGY